MNIREAITEYLAAKAEEDLRRCECALRVARGGDDLRPRPSFPVLGKSCGPGAGETRLPDRAAR